MEGVTNLAVLLVAAVSAAVAAEVLSHPIPQVSHNNNYYYYYSVDILPSEFDVRTVPSNYV